MTPYLTKCPFFMERIAVLNDKMSEKGLHTEGSLFEKKPDFDGGKFGKRIKQRFGNFKSP